MIGRWLLNLVSLGDRFEVCSRAVRADNHLRHASFIALREDRDAREVRRDGDAR